MTEVRYLGLNLSRVPPERKKQEAGPIGRLADLNEHLLCDIDLSPAMRARLKQPDRDHRWLDFRQPV
ncbi:hypothetical protein ACIQWS_09505 [Phyllobacterium sp. NPDC097923]|jgi:hypothetical protein|uniref:hypothetical protein n=1 Tax=Phyllobacterium sp. NPDC097923 TaxID=3364404 RepID=UPI00383BAB13